MKYAEVKKGLNYERFKKFIAYLYNIQGHPFSLELFHYFDKNNDQIVEFYEVVQSVNIIEKGDFSEKISLCF